MAKPKGAKGYAIVTPRGRIKVDTICEDRESALSLINDFDGSQGCKVRRVRVFLETEHTANKGT